MSLRLRLAELYTPRFVRKKKILELFGLTAQALGAPVPSLSGYSDESVLRAYARFTRDHAAARLEPAVRVEELKTDLYDRAFKFGSGLRRALRLSKPGDVMRAARFLYRFIGIEFRGHPDGTIVIRRCAFSDYYSAPVCALVSSLDEGVLAGLAGGGRLAFAKRITEGNDRCLATFTFPEGSP
jgi:hypothetical protein